MIDSRSIALREPGDEKRRGYTLQGFANLFSVSSSLIKRAASHGVIKVVYLGDKPIVPAEEVERISREGLSVPPGYRRKTADPGRGGRPRRKPKAGKAVKGRPAISPRRKREAERAAAPAID